jgi:hypothetical protein
MIIDTTKWRVSTKSIIAALMTFGGLMQIPAFSAYVLSITGHHPHLAALVTSVMGIYAVLHTPEVQDALGLKHRADRRGQETKRGDLR